jgi:hypothetical protein
MPISVSQAVTDGVIASTSEPLDRRANFNERAERTWARRSTRSSPISSRF